MSRWLPNCYKWLGLVYEDVLWAATTASTISHYFTLQNTSKYYKYIQIWDQKEDLHSAQSFLTPKVVSLRPGVAWQSRCGFEFFVPFICSLNKAPQSAPNWSGFTLFIVSSLSLHCLFIVSSSLFIPLPRQLQTTGVGDVRHVLKYHKIS